MKHRQKLGIMLLALALTLALPSGVALAASYTWVGQGADDEWSTCRNWVVVGLGGCYPNDSGDDATIPYSASGWSINLIDINQIDDFTIDSDVAFDSATGDDVTLVASTVTIAATNGESIVTVSNDSSITAVD
ncbi:MAG: hypothetical protein CHACPFDD_01731 [Phycisphaerae bacterium]|nr:hypothetical protein [Phycisphaerae bacterium]